MKKVIPALALAISLASSSCGNITYDLPNVIYKHYRKGKKWYYYGYTIKTNKNQIENNHFPLLHKAYNKADIYAKDSQCEKIEVKEIVKRSINGPKAMDYVAKGLETILEDYNEGWVEPGDLSLADYAIDYFRKDLSTDAGRGEYTLERECADKHEIEKDNFKVKYSITGDSRQTLDEFLSDGKVYKGDCDDFSIALLTSYEIMRNMSAEKKGEFWKKLNKQLQRKQIIYAVEMNHAINLSITYSQDFSKARVDPIEPQIYRNAHIEQDVIVSNFEGLVHIKRIRNKERILVQYSPILWVYNSAVSYKKKGL